MKVSLVPMTDGEFAVFVERAIPAYAAAHARAGNWTEDEALEKSRSAYADTLPDGLATKNHFLFTITDEETRAKVGVLWFMLDEDAPSKAAFLYEIRIWDEFQHRGYGRAAMEALERELVRRGARRVSLHVFGHNSIAIDLYRSLGYDTVDLVMAKRLAHSDGISQ